MLSSMAHNPAKRVAGTCAKKQPRLNGLNTHTSRCDLPMEIPVLLVIPALTKVTALAPTAINSFGGVAMAVAAAVSGPCALDFALFHCDWLVMNGFLPLL